MILRKRPKCECYGLVRPAVVNPANSDIIQERESLHASPRNFERERQVSEVVRIFYSIASTLDARYRAPYVMHVIHGLEVGEISASTGLTIAAVKSRIYRAKQEVFKKLKRRGITKQVLFAAA